MRTLSGLLMIAAVCAAAPFGRDDELPKWRGPEGTGISKETGLADKWPADGPRHVWSQKGTGGSLVRVGDRLIAMSERGKLWLIEATPEKHRLISQIGLFDFDRVWSTPMVYRGKRYAKGRDELVCLDISGGGARASAEGTSWR